MNEILGPGSGDDGCVPMTELDEFCALGFVADLTLTDGRKLAVVLGAAGPDGLIAEAWDDGDGKPSEEIVVIPLQDIISVRIP